MPQKNEHLSRSVAEENYFRGMLGSLNSLLVRHPTVLAWQPHIAPPLKIRRDEKPLQKPVGLAQNAVCSRLEQHIVPFSPFAT